MIEARDVLVTYDDTVAVDQVSLTIPDGQWVILAGANGSGKTSLVRTFNGLVSVESGEVVINGTPVTEDLVAARTAVAMVFQHPRDQIVAPTVEGDVAFGPANLGLSRDSIQDRVRESLAAVEMTGRESARIDALSGGERARVAIAGALAMQPDHLVLDEPFAGLDESARFAVLDRLEALSATGTGILIITHDLRDVLSPADRVVAIAHGAVAVDDPPEAAAARLPELGVRVPEEQ